MFARKALETSEQTASPDVCAVLVGTRCAVSVLPLVFPFRRCFCPTKWRWFFGYGGGFSDTAVVFRIRRWFFGHGTPCPYGVATPTRFDKSWLLACFSCRWFVWADTQVSPYYDTVFVCQFSSLGACGFAPVHLQGSFYSLTLSWRWDGLFQKRAL